jgi:hypothetical protein
MILTFMVVVDDHCSSIGNGNYCCVCDCVGVGILLLPRVTRHWALRKKGRVFYRIVPTVNYIQAISFIFHEAVLDVLSKINSQWGVLVIVMI